MDNSEPNGRDNHSPEKSAQDKDGNDAHRLDGSAHENKISRVTRIVLEGVFAIALATLAGVFAYCNHPVYFLLCSYLAVVSAPISVAIEVNDTWPHSKVFTVLGTIVSVLLVTVLFVWLALPYVVPNNTGLGSATAEGFASMSHPKFRLLVIGVGMALTVVLWSALIVAIRRHGNPVPVPPQPIPMFSEPSPAFSVLVSTKISGGGKPTPFYVVATTLPSRSAIAYNVYALLNMQFTNLRNTAMMVFSCAIEAQLPDGRWESVPLFSVPEFGQLYLAFDRKEAVEMVPNRTLKSVLYNVNLAPGESVVGWMILSSPKGALSDNCRVRIRDMAGNVFVEPIKYYFPTSQDSDFGSPDHVIQMASLQPKVPPIDISGLPVRLFEGENKSR
jgi:hypothetical protein